MGEVLLQLNILEKAIKEHLKHGAYDKPREKHGIDLKQF